MNQIDNFSAKSNIYYMLSVLYHYPTQENLNHIKELWPYLTKSLNELDIDEGLIQNWNINDIQENMEPLQLEYMRLFLGSLPNKTIISPYESYWKQNTIMGSPIEELSKIFNESELQLSQNYSDLPDHITVELEYLHFITKNIIECLKRDETDKVKRMISLRDKFVEDHLDWIYDFSKKLKHETKNFHYQNLAVLTRSIISTEL